MIYVKTTLVEENTHMFNASVPYSVGQCSPCSIKQKLLSENKKISVCYSSSTSETGFDLCRQVHIRLARNNNGHDNDAIVVRARILSTKVNYLATYIHGFIVSQYYSIPLYSLDVYYQKILVRTQLEHVIRIDR